jgi:hypothetical protein
MRMQDLQNRIIYLFSIFVAQIKGHKSMGNTDINRVAEDVLIPVFKEVYGYRNLKNLNHDKNNYPAIDLGDETAKIAIQVTATSDSGKIQETLKGFIKNEHYLTYERVQIYILTEKEGYNRSEKSFQEITQGKIQFDIDQDILDYRDLLKKISTFQVEQLQSICAILETNFGELTKSNSPTGIPSNLPRSGVVKFVGRDQKLQDLHAQLQQNDRIAITAIAGMGGIGKTELALQYAIAQLQQNHYPAGLCWLRARDQEIATQVVKFANQKLGLNPPDYLKEIDDRVGFCWQQWPEGDALVVLDDVTNYKAIEPYLPPPDPRFKLLITTRLKLGSSVKDLPVEELDEGSAIGLLESLVKGSRIQAQLENAKALCKWVGYLPLALELLGRFLARKPDWTINRLLEALDKERLDAEALSKSEEGMTLQFGVLAALQLSWQELNEAEQELACILGMFVIAPINWTLVEQCHSEVDPDELEDIRDNGLIARSLLKRVGEGTYQLHQIVQEYFRNKILISNNLILIQKKLTKAIGEIAERDLILAIKMLENVYMPEFNYLENKDILSLIEYGYTLREAYGSWAKGFGFISKLIAPLQHDGKLAQLQIQYLEEDIPEEYTITYQSKFRCLARIKTCWYYGNDLSNDVVEFEGEPKASNDSSWIEILEKKYPIINQPNFQALEAYRDSFQSFVDNLSNLINKRRILVYEGMLLEENSWRSAYFLTQRYWRNPGIMRLESISVSEIKNYISGYKNSSEILSKSVNIESFKQLIFKLEQIDRSGESKIDYPWEGQYIIEPNMALVRAHNIFMAALESYQLIVKTWFPTLKNDLYTLNLMPVRISGFVIDASKTSSQSNFLQNSSSNLDENQIKSPNYFVSWFWDILPSNLHNQVDFRWGFSPITFHDYRVVVEKNLPLFRPKISHHPYQIYTQDPTPFHNLYPVSTLVYSWLWNDLLKLKLVKGMYDTSYF